MKCRLDVCTLPSVAFQFCALFLRFLLDFVFLAPYFFHERENKERKVPLLSFPFPMQRTGYISGEVSPR